MSMLIDTHCHFDMMDNPEKFISIAESKGDIVIGMTNLPSYFRMGISHVRGCSRVKLALGFHPLLASEHKRELPLFEKYLDQTSYIGEIGLDFSKDGKESRDVQIDTLRTILSCLKGKKKIISVHSRKAERELLSLLEEYGIKNVIFHWYTGPKSLIPEIERQGYYFSINEAMTKSIQGRKIISTISKDRLLTETDAPFNQLINLQNVLEFSNVTRSQIMKNFFCLVDSVR